MKYTYLFYGFGSEYVLHDLYEMLQKKGHDCIEVDALKIPDSRQIIDDLQGKKIIFITSAHFVLDEKNFKCFYKTTHHFYGVLEILSLLKPIRSIYIPHDLTQPIIDFEKEFLNQFDLFCSPCEPFTSIYSEFCETREMGWIKLSNTFKTIIPHSKALWFLSDFVIHLSMGPENSYKMLAPVLTQHVSIKFPTWPGVEEFEKYFSEQGIFVYPHTYNSSDLIHSHELILTNGLSSIIAESSFSGKTTVNIMEGSHYGSHKSYLQELFPDLIFIEMIDQFLLKDIHIEKRPSVLKPFQYQDMLEYLDSI